MAELRFSLSIRDYSIMTNNEKREEMLHRAKLSTAIRDKLLHVLHGA